MAVTNNITATLQQLDSSGQTTVRRVNLFTNNTVTTGELRLGAFPDTTEQTINLPVVQPLQLYVKNTHASAKVTVKWTPNGGVKVTVLVLGPGDGIMFWHQASGSTYGVSLLTLTSDTANSTYEYFVGG